MIIVGIDPGTHNFGMGILTVDEDLNVIHAIPICINADAVLSAILSTRELEFSDRHDIIIEQVDSILAVLNEAPTAFAYEIPHFDRNKPQSYAVLMLHIHLLTKHLEEIYKVPVVGYRPAAIKAAIKANKKEKGEKSKDAVLRCMKLNRELVEAVDFSLDEYTDDAIDSVLIAFKHITEARGTI